MMARKTRAWVYGHTVTVMFLVAMGGYVILVAVRDVFA